MWGVDVVGGRVGTVVVGGFSHSFSVPSSHGQSGVEVAETGMLAIQCSFQAACSCGVQTVPRSSHLITGDGAAESGLARARPEPETTTPLATTAV
ncbi:hypothetical protein [Umezawaea beigongshangensis]|uniref:hypothetical protein n=1 Tax=Umezawaea beigongshangensis TaxID=2780383 RepID=UPI0018F20F21|nr:hypothetical protein [Umezawaea beigongshangensis]